MPELAGRGAVSLDSLFALGLSQGSPVVEQRVLRHEHFPLCKTEVIIEAIKVWIVKK
jgi:hypothetical protein